MLDRATGKVEVTSHNHGFAVRRRRLGRAPVVDTDFGAVEVSHVCLNDNVVEGLRALDVPAFTVQYHPEAAAGPHDADYLFDRFVELIEGAAVEPDDRERACLGGRTCGTCWSSGPGPIVIGQACEFDYSGTQACRVLRAEGLRVSLVNSNPATIMTDPEFADATYVEPITPEFVEKVIARERPDALLATLGGQTALNTAVALHEAGRAGQVRRGADRRRTSTRSAGARTASCSRRSWRGRRPDRPRRRDRRLVPRSRVCHSMDEVRATVGRARPAGGDPAVVHHGRSRLRHGAHRRGRWSGWPAPGWPPRPVHEVLIEESVLGWKEYELELMRDRHDNVVVVCSIENVDPMGVHTGDSVTVAPAMTLTDREYQRMRDLGIAVLREVGVDTGGCNIQFAVQPGRPAGSWSSR